MRCSFDSLWLHLLSKIAIRVVFQMMHPLLETMIFFYIITFFTLRKNTAKYNV